MRSLIIGYQSNGAIKNQLNSSKISNLSFASNESNWFFKPKTITPSIIFFEHRIDQFLYHFWIESKFVTSVKISDNIFPLFEPFFGKNSSLKNP